MIEIFTKTTKTKYLSKNKPKSLLTTIPAQARDFLELQHKSTLNWKGYVDENGKKCIKITKKE